MENQQESEHPDYMSEMASSNNQELLPELETSITKLHDIVANSQSNSSNASKSSSADHGRLGPLPIRGHDISTIIDILECILAHEDIGAPKGSISLPNLDPVGKAVVTAHSLAAYVSCLDRVHLQKLTTRIISDTTLWISRLFRFFDSSACFHDEPWEGLVCLCRALLRLRYPKFDEDGYEVLYPRPPIIYIGSTARSGLVQHLCTKLGLPRSCISLVPCSTVFGSQYKMDVTQLKRIIQDDLAAQKIPLLVIANAGATTLGQVDDLQHLQDICKAHDMWLHVEGHTLAGLCLVSAPTLPAKVGDSMTLSLGQWLGLPSLPNITLYKVLDPSVTVAAGLTVAMPQKKLTCLPVWAALQALGRDGVISRIHNAFQLTRHFQDKLSQVKSIKIIGKRQLDKEAKAFSVSELTSKPVSTTVLFDVLTPVVVFRYSGLDDSKTDVSDLVEKANNSQSYINSLNSWLGQILQRDVPIIHLDIIELDNCDVCLRYCSLDGHKSVESNTEILDLFISCIAQQAEILNATVKHRELFPHHVNKHSNLQCVHLADWAGLGGVRYIPKTVVGNLNDLPDTSKEEVNKINQDLVVLLKNTDSAFSLGEGDDNLYCVRFGMVTEDTDMEELIDLIVGTGQEIEENTKKFESMSEMVKKGIETANEDLKKESDERIWQDGVLRYVPIINSVYNWWSPLPKESGVKGRSFSLSSGVIESTENIYKYHMQIKQGAQSVGPTTPKPAVQTAVIIQSENDKTALNNSTEAQKSPTQASPSQSNKENLLEAFAVPTPP